MMDLLIYVLSKKFTICVDGEIFIHDNLSISLENKAIKFLIPHKEIDEEINLI